MCSSVSRYSVNTTADSPGAPQQSPERRHLGFVRGRRPARGLPASVEQPPLVRRIRQDRRSAGHAGASSSAISSPCGSPSGSTSCAAASLAPTAAAPRDGDRPIGRATRRSTARVCAGRTARASAPRGARDGPRGPPRCSARDFACIRALVAARPARGRCGRAAARRCRRPRVSAGRRAADRASSAPSPQSDANARRSPLCGVAVSSST